MKKISEMTVKDLRKYATENGIKITKTRKDDIIAEIEAALNAAGTTSPPPDIRGLTINRVLKVTKPLMKGEDVKATQETLIAAGYGLGVDGANGIYGASTALAVRHFQSMNRLIVNGHINKHTVQALGGTWEEAPEE